MTPSVADIQQAAAILESGGLVAFPTETVYGLGADAENPTAVARIFAAKGRPANHPVIVHLAPEAVLDYWAVAIPAEARKLISACWPGPLTLILKRAAHIPDAVSGGQDSIGLRCPSDPIAQALLRAFKGGKGGIAAPSANRFGHVSPTAAEHVRDEFDIGPGRAVDFLLDGGPCEVGIESTILDLSRMDARGPVLLRPGGVSGARIAELIGIQPASPDADAPRASGTLDSHYAPNTPVALLDGQQLASVLSRLANAGRRVSLLSFSMSSSPNSVAHISLPDAPNGYAHGLYAALRELDAAKTDIILVESPPTTEEWRGINDRLNRAAHDSVRQLQYFLR